MANENGPPNGISRLLMPVGLGVTLVTAAFGLGQMIGEGQGGSDALESRVARLSSKVTTLEEEVAALSKAMALLRYRLDGEASHGRGLN